MLPAAGEALSSFHVYIHIQALPTDLETPGSYRKPKGKIFIVINLAFPVNTLAS